MVVLRSQRLVHDVGGGESPIDTPVQTLNGEKMKTIEANIVLGLLGNKKCPTTMVSIYLF